MKRQPFVAAFFVRFVRSFAGWVPLARSRTSRSAGLCSRGNITLTSRGLQTNREYWQKMEELYHAALEKSGEAREALSADSDPEVRRGVEVLLAQGTSGTRCWIVLRGSRLILPWRLRRPRKSLPVTNSDRIV